MTGLSGRVTGSTGRYCIVDGTVRILRRMKDANTPLTAKQRAFARHLFEGKTQIEAYKLSYDATEMSDANVRVEATKLARHPNIEALVAELQEQADFVSVLSVDWVLRQYMLIATADVNELVESRRVCCRHCYGIGHAYQWRDANEWALELARVMDENDKRLKAWRGRTGEPPTPTPLPTFDGGGGFWATKPPVETCPHCYGVGHQEVFTHDTRKLKGPAKLLYAGIKQTANGPQILTRNQDVALEVLAKYIGVDKKNVELTGPGGGPIKSIAAMTSDPTEAAKLYAAIMNGK
jgi:phage terminase small subunit